jgi:hypothetical protein
VKMVLIAVTLGMVPSNAEEVVPKFTPGHCALLSQVGTELPEVCPPVTKQRRVATQPPPTVRQRPPVKKRPVTRSNR